ncbi:hypothetical protein SPFM20_00123 [Salmonella phage SPFM20]|nr:hypothetical protein SPFM20_00123 [Salmonella phage SPFM20]
MMECNPYTKSAPKVKSATSSAPVERFYVDRFVYMFTLKPAPTGVIGLAVERNRAHCVSEFDIVHDTWRYNRAVGTPYGDAVANLPATTLFGIMLGTIISGTLFKKQNIPGGLVASADGIDKVTDPTKPVVVEFVTDEYQEFLDYLADLDANRLAVGGNKSIVNWVSVGTVKPNVYVYGREDGMSWTRPGMAGEGQPGRYTAFEQWNTPATGSPVVAQFTGYQSRYYGGPGGDWGTNNRNGLAGSRDKGGATQLTTKIGGAGGAPLGPGAAVPSIENYGTIAGGGGGGDYYAFSTSADGADAIHITDTFRGKVTNRGTILGRGGSGMVYSLPANKPTFVIDELPQIGEVVWNFVRLFVNVTVDAGAFVYRDSNLTSQVSDSYWATTLTNHAACGTLNVARYQDNEQTLNLNYTTWPRQVQLAPVEGSYKVMGSAGIRSVFDVNEIAPVENLAGETYVPDDFTGSLHDALAIETLFGTKYVFFSRNKLETYAGKTGQTSAYNSVVALTARPGSGMKRIVDLDKVDVSAPMSPEDIILTLKAANKQQWINFYSNAVTLDVINGDVDINTVYTVTNINAARITFQAKQTSLVWYGSQLLGITFLTDDFEDLPITWTNKLDAIPTCASIHELLPHLDTYGQITAQVTKQNIADYFAKVAHRDEKTLDVTLTGGPGYSNNRKNAVAKAVDPANVRLVSVD